MELDIRTLSIITVVFAAMSSLGMSAFGRDHSKYKGFRIFAGAFASMAVGFFLIALRDQTSQFYSIIVANFLILLGQILLYEGICVFRGGTFGIHVISYLILIPHTFFSWYFAFLEPSVNIRIVAIAIAFFVIRIASIYEIRNHSPKEHKSPVRLGSFLFGITAAYQLFRIIDAVYGDVIANFMQANIVHGIAYVLTQMLIVGFPFVILWMVSINLEMELINQAIFDPLTNVYNRRGIENMINRELANVIRNNEPISLIFVDIDNFKRFNDEHGHSFGDRVLKEIALVLQTQLRQHDVLGRYGGEEFLVVLPETGRNNAAEVAERIRKFVAENVIIIDDKEVSLTASFGLSACEDCDPDWERMLDEADMLMYQAKEKGKNRVEYILDQS